MMQPITGRAARRRTSPLASSDPTTDALPDAFSSDVSPPVLSDSNARRLETHDPLARLLEDDLSDEDDKNDEDNEDDGGEEDAVEGAGHPASARSVLLPLAAAVVLAAVGAACLLPVRLPWEASTPPPVSTTAAPPQALMTPPGTGGSGSASSTTSPALAGATSPPASASTAPTAVSVAPSTSMVGTEAAAGADTSAIPTPEDTLAGPVSDQVLQDLLISSLPPERTITDPALVGSADGGALLEAGWQALAADVEAGGWTQPRQQAHAVLRTGRDDTQALPIVVDVVFMWAALAGQGEPTERELSTVRVTKGGGSWVAGKITTASDGN